MEKYINFIQKFRWAIAIIIPLFVLLLASNLKNLSFEGSYRIWFGEDSKILNNYDDFRNIFGNDDGIVITFKDESGIFHEKALSSIQRLTDKLWETKYVTRVDSITSYQHVHADIEYPDEIIVEDFIQNIDSESQEYFDDRKNIALKDPQIVNSLISKDGTTTMIVARLIAKAGENEDISFELMGYINDIIKDEVEKTGYKYWVSGGAAITTSFVTIAQDDGGFFTPLAIVSVMVLLFLLFRRVGGMLIPMAVVVFTMLIVLSIQVMLGYKLNNFTANIPVFIIAIGIADAVHVYIIWLAYRKEGMENKLAVQRTLEKNFLPIFLTSLTTSVGFASLTISEIVPVATLGIATASGAILAFFLSVVLMPALLLLLNKDIQKSDKTELDKKTIDERYQNYAKFLVQNDKKILFFTTLLFGFFALGLFHVKVDSNTIRYFDKEVEIRKATEFISENLTGSMSYEIVVDSKAKDGIKDPEFLRYVDRFYSEFYEKYPDVRHIISLLDTVKQFHKVMNGDEQKFYTVPDSKELVAQYLLLYSLSLPQGMEINDKMDIEERLLRVSAKINLVDTSKDLEMIEWVEKWWESTPYSAKVNGQTAMFAYMQSDVTDTLIYSISIAMTLVSVMMLIIFKNIRMLFIFILPNILPIILVVGVMGWLGITIDMGVAVSGAIVLGVAVDDSIYFFVKYFDARKKGFSLEESFAYVFKYAGTAILFTTIILSLSFLLFMGSEFAPNYNFGIVTASALVIAFIADLLLLPALLSVMEKRNSLKA
jgi:hydrophobe/amphiphile efflux-3 (HAE3) family protein